MWMYCLCVVVAGCLVVDVVVCEEPKISDVARAKEWLTEYDRKLGQIKNEETLAEWSYNTDIRNETQNIMVSKQVESSAFSKEAFKNASRFDWQRFGDEDVKRQFKLISNIGPSALQNHTKVLRMNQAISEMEAIYSTASVCLNQSYCLELDPGLTDIMTHSRNEADLKAAWLGWRDATGPKMRSLYEEFVGLSNEGSRQAGNSDTGDYWRSWYETPTFQQDLERLLEQLKPLYTELHTYVRRKLTDLYGEDKFPSTGHIPAHLLGNMWAQEWGNIYDIVEPYRNKSATDVTSSLKQASYNATRMFMAADEFFQSLGLEKMPGTFWTNSMFVKPVDGRKVVCHASAWDFYDGTDFRIKMCTDINMNELITIHHEMGHIEYFLLYKNQSQVYRDGANPGFHEAIGDTIALSVATPTHLNRIGLLSQSNFDYETEINYLMKMALNKIAFLPFGYLIDQWRWSVFSGDTPSSEYNKHWWDMRCKYQGIAPPSERTENDFDPGAKFHIPANVPYIRYFVSFVIQFQFHKALCKLAGQNDSLHRCDIYQSTAAGDKLRHALSLGSSKPWPEVMEIMTGQRQMDAGALLEYFKPLTDWLKDRNALEKHGWSDSCPITDEQLAVSWLESYNTRVQHVMYGAYEASWTYSTNITHETEKAKVEAEVQSSKFTKEAARNASNFDYKHFKDEGIKRQLKSITDIGTDALKEEAKIKRLSEVVAGMEGIFSTGKVCLDPSDATNCLGLQPGVARTFAGSRDYDELKAVWKGWRDATGKKMRSLFHELVNLSNEGVRELGYRDNGEYWRSWYETESFQQDLVSLMDQLKPLYQQLHTYVRKELKKTYGPDKFPVTGHIPAHILGNLWAQEWGNVYNLMVPFRNKARVDITPTMKAKNFTARKMFEIAEEFYTSIGLSAMPEEFWNKSMIVKPSDGRDVVCYASAWDFSNQKDFRIKMCTDITMEDLSTIHHEMGHIEYYLQYKHQPVIFRAGANPGFHEAIGDTMALSVSTPKHLRKIDLLKPGPEDDESDINFLMKTALDKIAFLPFGYLIDQWRWSVFSGDTPPSEWNSKWWDLRCKYQGIAPPVVRSEDDFDPGAKYHVAANVPYIRYFVSFVIQFQFHKALCDKAGQTGPLHRCDIYRSTAAGNKLRTLLAMGSSKPWQDAMEVLTGQRQMNASALMEYFDPLIKWLKVQNEGELQGWTDLCPDPESGKISDLGQAEEFLADYERQAMAVYYRSSEASWAYETNMTDHNSDAMIEENLKESKFSKVVARNASMFNWKKFEDKLLIRKFETLSSLGTSAQKDLAKIKRLNKVQSEMTNIYSTGKVCLNSSQCLELEPGITRLMAESRDYDTLTTVWKKWRDVTGKKMKSLYQEFVQLSNEGARADDYADTGDLWRSYYETDSFEKDLQDLLHQLKPLYQQLHVYVKRKLVQVYGEDKFPEGGHIPAHLLGNMWAQEWGNIFNILQPFKGKSAIDVTDEMRAQNYTVLKMFKTAEDFYLSLGLRKMPDSFWKKSMISKPADGRPVVCHASAWDFFNNKDFRIKMCTDITMEDLMTIHHEMGHIQYYLQYIDQPIVFKGGANPGFHEAVGDVMALSVSTPKHLQKIGLIKNLVEDKESEINYLMKMALDKIAFLPFGYLMDQWRWSVFRGDTPPKEYTQKWWDLRCKHQGISPPVHRTADDFDPGAKFHIADNTPYIRYFISNVIQFQFQKALCTAANQTGPLNRCDIYQSKAAGQKLSAMLRLGESKPWPDALFALTGQRKMDVGPLVDYFKPLLDWLEKENRGHIIGWDERCPPGKVGLIADVNEAKKWLLKFEEKVENVTVTAVNASFIYKTNITDHNKQKRVETNLAAAAFDKKSAAEAERFDWENFADMTLKRQFQKITDIGTSALKNLTKLETRANLQSEMDEIYSKGKVCLTNGTCYDFAPGLNRLMAKSTDYDVLLHIWKGWRDATGKKIKEKYRQFVAISNEAVTEIGYHDVGEYWRSQFETSTFQKDIAKLIEQLQPFYKQLHAYVRRKLIKKYGRQRFPYSGHIPAHLLGNMWGQQWTNIYDITAPFPNRTGVDVTPQIIEQGYTVEKMFWTAEDFFKSLGLDAMPMSFWKDSMLKKPNDRDVVCHASAWDFYNGKDFRIKMCTELTMDDLITIHHEMGHVQYYLQYKHLPHVFRRGGNPGFHEAIGDVMALSVATPGHLHKIGLLEKLEDDSETDLNYLMLMALDKIAFLPFGYLVDQWRWSVFSGDTPVSRYNTDWWKLRCKYQGISPPIKRTEDDFDPGAKSHIPSNTPYIRYFVSFVIQFQFHKALCQAAGHSGPLHKCDIYNSTRAGKLLGDMLKLGSSSPWPDAMEVITGQRKMDAGALIEYFQPLSDWLKEQNQGRDVGWEEACPEEGLDPLVVFLDEYDHDAEKHREQMYFADWAYETNITDETAAASVKGRNYLAAFEKEAAAIANSYDWKNLTDGTMKRRFKMITNIGTSAMRDKSKLKRMNELQSKMEGMYGTGTVCLENNKCLTLEPDLEKIMSTSHDYDKLLTVWRGWRDSTGKKMKSLYEEFVSLSNDGVKELGYPDTGEYWRSSYESDTFQVDLENMLTQLRPLYEQLHTYVRKELRKVYTGHKFPESGHIPAHLLGNMWAQEWNNLYDILQPYKNRSSVDITPAMVRQGYTVNQMFRTAEHFFLSLGLEKMPDTFWKDSVLAKPAGRSNLVCHASAWDFFNAKDFRIKMCTDINMEDLVTIHHEMGHIQYFLQYKHQPQSFRDGANPGFHEAIGDTMALSVATPKHLRRIGLLGESQDNYLDDINFLLKMSLEKIAFLPFGYLIDQWRWSVFSGETTSDRYNAKWWELRCKYQGISPPVKRTEQDFDPGAKYHIPDNTPYIRYFVSFVVQFQFHKALCEAAGHTGPLHKCDIYQSAAAGKLLGDMLRLGSSKPWPDVMEQMTGQRKMDVGPLIKYFKPLVDWLKEQNKMERPGWTEACPTFDDAGKRQQRTTKTPIPKKQPDTSNANIVTSQLSVKITLILFLILKIIF
ncbi:uncharacterized protein LOC121385251 [Gigantopelta aegis]|uniref:uncharacterized protein LOC121385251 n=1 Tax=Gigantopelta aegis TaxID=1735272 RepID=UPI001B88D6DC|nr:uncharacterized protein LOC121385251 [Gigantopelta aegis]